MTEISADPYHCPLCSHDKFSLIEDKVLDFEYGAPGEYRWLRCNQCNLIRLDPFPSSQVLAQAYPAHYHAYQESKSVITRKLIDFSKRHVAKSLVKRLSGKGAVLDVGCGTGKLLQEIRKLGEYEVFGVEYHKASAEVAKRANIKVWEGDFSGLDLPEVSMDLIILQHVLEHLFQPIEDLKKIYRILKPNGLLVGEIPNFASWDCQIFGRYWGGGHAPRHIFHFTPKTLREALVFCGFKDIEISPVLHTGHWACSFQNFFRRKKTHGDILIGGRTWYYPLFLLLAVPINLLQMPFRKTGIMAFSGRKP